MKKARNPFVSNSRHRISDPPVINVILKKSSTMYRSIGPRTIPSIYSSVLTLSSLSLSPRMRVKKVCVPCTVFADRIFERAHARAHAHTHREEEGRTGDGDIFPWGRESCSARRRPVSQYISGMHGAFHDKIFQYWHPVSIYRAAREIRRAVGTYLYEFHFGWLYSRYSAGGSAGKMVEQRWTNHFDGACTLTISITFR